MITTHERWLIVYVKDRVFLTPLTLATHRKYEAELKTNVRSLGGPGRYDIFGGIVEVKQTCMKKEKKINAKALRYAKFQKDKPAVVDITMPDLTEEANKQKQLDQDRIDRFLKNNRNPQTKEISERRMRSKLIESTFSKTHWLNLNPNSENNAKN